MKAVTFGVLAAALTLCVISPASAQSFKAELNGGEENPPVSTNTRGKAKVKFKGDVAKFFVKLKAAEGITQAHIHCAPQGQNGPIVAFLAGFHDRGWNIPTGRWVTAELTDANVIALNTNDENQDERCPNSIENLADLAEAAGQGNTYVNVHSLVNPSGEVRGQLR